jgi:hypothetical protein
MTNMRPPQQWQGWASGCAAAGSISTAVLGHRGGQTQELARPRDRLGAITGGEQAVVADAVEAAWQHVDEKPANELADVERHRRVPAGAFDPVILTLNVTLR